MIKHIRLQSFLFFLLSTLFAQDILFITPNQGVQGTNDLTVTLIVSDVNFYDEYTYNDVYFSGSGLNASNEHAVSSNSLEFNLDIESHASIDDYTIYLSHGHEWYDENWTVSETNAFTVLENTSEIISISPDSVQAGTTETLVIYGYDTGWDGSSQVSINNNGYVDINWVNNLSSTELEIEISVDQWAYTGSYDITVTTGSSFITLQNGISITPPDPIEILSIEPGSGDQGTNDLILTIEVFNGNFNDEYAGRSVFFSGSGINVQQTWGISDEVLQARIDIDTWAELGLHDLTVGISGPWGEGQYQYDTMEEAFFVESSSHQLLSISPSSSYPTNDLILTLVGQGTNWSSDSPQLNFNSSSGIYVNWVNAVSDTMLQAQIDISSWAGTGYRDVTVESGSQIVGLQNVFEIKNPEVISLTPSAGVQGTQNLEVTLIAGGVNFYDIYTYIDNIYFSGSGLNTNNYSITSNSSVSFQVDIEQWAASDSRDVILTFYNSSVSGDEILMNSAFTVIEGEFSPTIYDIVDVPVDQGGWARLHFLACDLENMLGSYTIFREFPATRDWEIIGSFNPLGDSTYIYLVSTLGNASPEDTTYTTYKVSYALDTYIWYSDPYSGYSIDNIAPTTPSDLFAYFEETTVYLNWAQPIDADFSYFSVYRDNLEIAQTTESYYEDMPEFGELSYYITANDVNGNVSTPSNSETLMAGNLGDTNFDGSVDILDCVRIVNYILGNLQFSDEEISAADFNADDIVDILDIVQIINYILDI